MSKKEIGIQANFHSSNTDNALHLNKIEMRSLKLEHERLQRDHKYHIKNGLRETKAIEQNLLELPDSTGCIGDRIFSDSKFQHLMIPIKREALLQDEPAPSKFILKSFADLSEISISMYKNNLSLIIPTN